MLKPRLIEIILSRIAKEYGFFDMFKTTYDRGLFDIKLDEIKQDIDLCFDTSDLLSNNRPLYDLFFSVNDFSIEINVILFEYVKTIIDIFLEKYNIKEIFNYNINNGVFYDTLKDSGNINELINILEDDAHSPFDLFSDTFSWSDTEQGYDFWSDINDKYRIFLIDKLYDNE